MPQNHDHPYKKHEGTSLWRTIDDALRQLEGNSDVQLTTAREYVIGFLCERISAEAGTGA